MLGMMFSLERHPVAAKRQKSTFIQLVNLVSKYSLEYLKFHKMQLVVENLPDRLKT